MEIQIRKPKLGQEHNLAEIRALSMKESLIAVGRYDEVRVRNRLLSNYAIDEVKVIYFENIEIGFYSVNVTDNVCFINHLYVLPNYQGKGIGLKIIDIIKSEYRGYVLRLNALIGSKANEFYERNGFMLIDCTKFDNVYELNNIENG